MAKRQYSGPWRRIRREILVRDNYECQIRGYGCTRVAVEVDHILPVAMGGDWFDKENLRGSCRTCNLARNIKARTVGSRQW